MSQAQFDQQVAQINEKLDAIGASVANEAQQIREFIAANPSVDTSALSSVVDRLDAVDTSIGDIFTPPAEEVVDEGNTSAPVETPSEELPPADEPVETPSEEAPAETAETLKEESDEAPTEEATDIPATDGGDPQGGGHEG